MFFDNLLRIVGVAFLIGLLALLFATLLLMPASFVMNKFIYHHWSMRLVLGLLTSMGSIFSLIFMIVWRVMDGKAHYFGLLPVWQSSNSVGEAESGSYIKGILVKILDYVFHPIMMFYETTDDIAGYRQSIERLLKGDGPKVNEDLFLKARQAGEINDQGKWIKTVENLSPDFEKLFAHQEAV